MRPSSKEAHCRLMVLKCVVGHSLVNPPQAVFRDVFAKWSEDDRAEYDLKSKVDTDANVAAMRKAGLWDYASPAEKEFLQSSGSRMDEYAQVAASWRIECIAMIMWALGLLKDWPKIDKTTDHDLLKVIQLQRISLLSKHPNLRPNKDVSGRRDLIELWHWRVRTRQLIEEGPPFTPDDDMKKAGLNTLDDVVRFSARAAREQGDLPYTLDDDFVFLGKSFRSLSTEEYEMATSVIMERHYALNWLCGLAPGNRWDETPTDT